MVIELERYVNDPYLFARKFHRKELLKMDKNDRDAFMKRWKRGMMTMEVYWDTQY